MAEPTEIADDEYVSEEFDDELRAVATETVRQMYEAAAGLERRDGSVELSTFLGDHLARSAVLIGRLAGEVERLHHEVEALKRDR